MRLTLSPTDSARYTAGADAARQIEAVLRLWATEHHLEEPVVVALATGETACVLCMQQEVAP
jgi:hypothetical protein